MPIGKNNGNWKGGKFKSTQGYVLITVYPYRKPFLEHRYTMSKHLNRPLSKNEIVHHINGDKTDNRIENLEILSRSSHARIHSIGRIFSKESRNKMRLARLGITLSDITKIKISKALIGRKPTEATRKKLRLARTKRVFTKQTREKMSAWQIGRKMSKEAKSKMSLAKKRYWSLRK